jgi:hypothetical protein
MKAVFKSSYPSKNGNEVFVFRVNGTVDEVEQYATENPLMPSEDDGTPLFMTTFPTFNYADKAGVEMYRSTKGKYSLENSEIRRAQALAKSMGAETEFRSAMVQSVIGSVFKLKASNPFASVTVATEAPVAEIAPSDLEAGVNGEQ